MPEPHTGVLEDDLYPAIMEHFLKQNYKVELEVAIHRNRIDLFAYNQKNTIAVELKLKNWKRALRQAAYYQLAADYTYIAMPFHQAVKVHNRKYLLENEGVGLFGILLDSGEVRELIMPKLSEKKLEYMESGILSSLGKRYCNSRNFY